jgi:hypothetical protein
MANRKLPRTAFLNDNFRISVENFGLELKRTGLINHRGNKGSAREDSLRQFFSEKLPKKFSVAGGEVVDLLGNTSPQLDLMFYDQNINFALNSDSSMVLPAEALIASIEVKSQINAGEIKKIVRSAKKLRQLKPFGCDLGGTDVGNNARHKKLVRYYHCVFAYGTDLTDEDWFGSEPRRFLKEIRDDHLVDAVYVLNKGIFLPPHKIVRLEDERGGAISGLYFAILNFLQRESARREPAPYERYIKPTQGAWKRID